MRLLIVSQTNLYWTPLYARYFRDRGDTVRVVSMAPEPIDGIDVEFIGVEPFDKFKNKRLFITRVPRIRRIIRRFRPDLVFAPYIVSNGLSAALAWSGPLVVSAMGGDVLEQAGRTGWRQRLRERAIRYVGRRADLVHCVAQAIQDELVRMGVPASKLVQFPIGVDLDLFYPDTTMPRPAPTQLICTRKHEPIYDNQTIVAALARLKAAGRDFHCTFVDDGYLLEARRAQAQTLGVLDRATFTGHIPYADVPRLLRAADIYVSASLSDGASSALMEAMATGLLPVVSRIDANTPWIDDGQTGLMFDCGRADQLAEALMRAMDDVALRNRAFTQNRERVEKDGNLEHNNEHLAEAFEQVVSAHRPATIH
jgi:glycosyltransferase involved in cell wall biosynthesis